MAPTDPLETAIDGLGYRGAAGYVDSEQAPASVARAFVWRELEEKGRLDGAYFRGAIPLVGFARLEGGSDLPRLQRRLWNLSRVPLLVAGTDEGVGVYSCFVPPSPNLDVSRAEIKAAQAKENIPDILADFSRFQVEAGLVTAKYAGYFDRKHRVDRYLLSNLRELRRELGGGQGNAEAVNNLIGRLIFIRYFEQRGILSPEHLAELTDRDSVIDVLRSGTRSTQRLFGGLAERFDGDLFSEPRQRTKWSREDLASLADFFSAADIPSRQQALWPYDFSIIPPELISSIYEQLLEETQSEDAAYYTPRHVVDLILDEVLPWEGTTIPRILDPACGSGIFLTEAYRRINFRHGLAAKTPPTFRELAARLTRSIFGIDRNPAAITVAAFGLYLAMLEEVDPPTAWRDARLPPLIGTNLITADFFSEHHFRDQHFDVIVGNPPWQSALTEDAASFVAASEVEVADRQIATAFLWRAQEMLAADGVVGLLLPAKQLLHNKADKAIRVRKKIFESMRVDTLIDLSPLRRSTFNAAIAPAVVFVARPAPGGVSVGHEILHVVPRNSPLQAAVEGFVVAQDDIHRISQDLATNYPDVWKIFLWGSSADLQLVTRLRANFCTIGEVVEKHGWRASRGFAVQGAANDASHIVGMRVVPAKAILPFKELASEPTFVADEVMDRPRSRELFMGPHILIRRGLVQGRPAAVLVKDDAAFNNSIFGIAAPSRNVDDLRIITAYVNSSLGTYYHFMTSGSWGVEREFLEQSEHLALPFAQVSGPTGRRLLEAARKAERRSIADDVSWRDEVDEAVFSAYDLTDEEVRTVRDALATSLDQFERGHASSAFSPPTEEALLDYQDALSAYLSSALPSLSPLVGLRSGPAAYGVASISLSADRNPEVVAESSERLVQDLIAQVDTATSEWPSHATVLQPSLLILDQDVIHIVKPNELRFWTSGTARSDAGEVLGAVGLSQQVGV